MKKVTNKAILLVIIVTLFSCQENKTIKWWSSREGKCFEEQRNLLWKLKSDSVKNLNCEIFLDSTEQEIDGFGGCFNELGWDALQKLEEPRREKVLNALFGKNDGLKFNLCRMPIGASDYSRNYYSLNDSVDDFSMEYF